MHKIFGLDCMYQSLGGVQSSGAVKDAVIGLCLDRIVFGLERPGSAQKGARRLLETRNDPLPRHTYNS